MVLSRPARGQDGDVMLADRDRRLAVAGEAAGAAGEREAAAGDDAVLRRAFQDVGAADEAGDELGLGPLVDVLGRARLVDDPWFITTMTSAVVIASAWSCVT